MHFMVSSDPSGVRVRVGVGWDGGKSELRLILPSQVYSGDKIF